MSEVKTNKISSLASNNNITIDPDGTGNTIIASGEVGVGTTTPTTYTDYVSGSHAPSVVVAGSQPSYVLADTDISGNDGTFGITKGGEDTTLNNLGAGAMKFFNNGSQAAQISADGTFCFGTSTTAVNSSSSESGMSIQKAGILAVARSGGDVASFNRQTNDGTVVQIHQAGTVEGTISVSGSTVSYNGGHLSRWSQATDGNRIDGLVKGTVMTNLDQMAEWTKDGVTEDNEQLNCMAVSSVEGDANVAGVFVNWDDDDKDYTADMNVAMTGDMVIRIASGTTVARGDLLMSAGDGTAKPQDDDIVRSKTIAKVTSTTKSHTYDDGSYLVPCVLMAC